MKLKTKLMPLAILTVASGAIVPLSTACSNNSGLKMTNLNSVEDALPKFDQLATDNDWLDDDDATDEYVALLKKNPGAFVEDMKWGIYQNWLSFYENSDFQIVDEDEITSAPKFLFDSEINSLKVGVSEPKLSTVQIYVPGEGKDQDHEYNTISFKMKVDVDADVKTLNRNGVVSYKNIKASTEVEYKNMIFYAFAASRDEKVPSQEDVNYYFDDYTDRYVPYPLNPNMDYDTTKPGWFITISDISGNQDLYDYNQEDWGITYSGSMVCDNTTYINGQESHKVNTYEYSDNVDNSAKLNNLVNRKSYFNNVNGGSLYNENWWMWFNQEPEQLIANSVLMDTVTHYFPTTVFSTPKLVSTDQSKELFGPMFSYPYNIERSSFASEFTQIDDLVGDSNPWKMIDDPTAKWDLNNYIRAAGFSFHNASINKLGEESLVQWSDGDKYGEEAQLVLNIDPNKSNGPVYLKSDASDFVNPLYDLLKNRFRPADITKFENLLLKGNEYIPAGSSIPNARTLKVSDSEIAFTNLRGDKINDENGSLVPLSIGSYDSDTSLLLDNPIPSTFLMAYTLNSARLNTIDFWNIARSGELKNFIQNYIPNQYISQLSRIIRGSVTTGKITEEDAAFIKNYVWQFDMPACYFDTKWVRDVWTNYGESDYIVKYDAEKSPALYFELPSNTMARAYLMWGKEDHDQHNTEEYPDYPYFTLDFPLTYNELKLQVRDVYGYDSYPVYPHSPQAF